MRSPVPVVTLFALLATPSVVPAQPARDATREVYRLLSRGEVQAAYDTAQAVVMRHPFDAAAQVAAGEAAGTLAGRVPIWKVISLARESRAHYQSALKIDPVFAPALAGLAAYLAQAPGLLGGNSDEAFRVAERLSRVDSVRGALARIRVLVAKSTPRRVTDSLVASLRQRFPSDTLVLAGAAEYYEGERVWTNAVEARRRLYQMDACAEHGFRLGRALIGAGAFSPADSVLSEARGAERALGEAGWVGAPRIAWQLAVSAVRQRDGLAAGRWIDSVLAGDPKHAGAHRMRDSLRAAGVR